MWAFGAVAGKRERSNADQRLVHAINVAGKRYQAASGTAQARAVRIAKNRRVQRALAGPDRRDLRRLQRAYAAGGVFLLRPGTPLPATMGRADVKVRGRVAGRVLVGSLDQRLARRLAAGREPDRVGFLIGDRLVTGASTTSVPASAEREKPFDLSSYRAVAVSVPASAGSAALVALEPRSEISAAATRARWEAALVGLGVIAALLLIAYAAAPAIARSRLSRQQRDQAERVLAHLGDGVVVVDRGGVVRLWNRAAEAITGLRATDVTNRPAEEAIPGWATIASFVPIANRPGDGDGTTTEETVPVDVDGRELWLSMVAVALDDDTVYAFRDATHERRLENLRSQFVATISHELRTPLASLHGAALTLREHDLPAQTQDDLLTMIAEQSNRLAQLVEEILVAGQLDSGLLSVVADTFDPEELVRDVVAGGRTRIGEETTIEVSLPAVLPKVHGDEERTRQVLLNLVDNAIKYSPSGGRIDVTVEPVGEWLRFSVSDEGLGIPPGEQERIFEKFYRLDPDQRRGIGGTGLGLYICREFVRAMGGRIWVESEPGRGTTASFELPAEPVAAAARAS
ncbi:MAG TPA: ATP-binding protein [Gaiellaceae bacterium]|nr:ATP-binding protein [Gaiellaceae bacterium]